mmetsp:Transcript_48325/g.120969  ORF Transcript_48325/g.120969 Transcript_48325/m.120969 type:complete len:209 (-) Transcript_48325:63-689(-)
MCVHSQVRPSIHPSPLPQSPHGATQSTTREGKSKVHTHTKGHISHQPLVPSASQTFSKTSSSFLVCVCLCVCMVYQGPLIRQTAVVILNTDVPSPLALLPVARPPNRHTTHNTRTDGLGVIDLNQAVESLNHTHTHTHTASTARSVGRGREEDPMCPCREAGVQAVARHTTHSTHSKAAANQPCHAMPCRQCPAVRYMYHTNDTDRKR